MFFFLLFAVPPLGEQITGLGLIKHFFTIDYIRLLSLAVLLPAFLSIRTRPDTERFGRSIPDKLILSYIVLNFLLMFTASTFTNTLRHGVFYAFVDIFLPYYVASRAVRTSQSFRDVLMSFVVAALVLSAIAAFEFAKHWLLYSALQDALGVRWGFGAYLERGEGAVRAQATTGQPIPLGYVMAVAIGFHFYLRKLIPSAITWYAGLVFLIVGLVAPISRGPWIGAMAILIMYTAIGPFPSRRLAVSGLFFGVALPLFLFFYAQSINDYLPFLRNVDESTVTYRQRLLEISIEVIMQNPLFGAFDFFYSPAMQELKQGQGIIDIVNSYLGIGLSSGLVGLSLFCGFFVVIGFGVFGAMRNVLNRDSELFLLGRVLSSTLFGVLVIIFTVSSVSVIPIIYWSLAGLAAAYTRMASSIQGVPAAVKSEILQRASINARI